MELNQIEYFLEVAKSEHITQSAQRLHIAQPALSQSIRRLEKELGVALFEKKGRNIVLTQYGKYLQSQLSPIMEKLNSLPSKLQKMARVNSETIHLNVLAASTMIIDAIIEFGAEHNDIDFQLLQSEQEDNPDIEITTKIQHKIHPENEERQFAVPEKIFLAVPKSSRFANQGSITLSEVENEQFISLLGSKQFRFICDKYCRQADINPHIIFESDSPAAVKNMIAANLGIGFWPEFTWGKIDNDNVKLLEIADLNCSRDIVFTCSASRIENENIRCFFEFLKSYCEKRRSVL